MMISIAEAATKEARARRNNTGLDYSSRGCQHCHLGACPRCGGRGDYEGHGDVREDPDERPCHSCGGNGQCQSCAPVCPTENEVAWAELELLALDIIATEQRLAALHVARKSQETKATNIGAKHGTPVAVPPAPPKPPPPKMTSKQYAALQLIAAGDQHFGTQVTVSIGKALANLRYATNTGWGRGAAPKYTLTDRGRARLKEDADLVDMIEATV
jgi:hypothetical protein